ncbi:Small ribosomal subunit uS7m-like protein [Cladobotryum mycophilum]|uniref:Small ribosomal subunit uS7m-like protein n=1 Tax=Cladobotryum mycophilum TaxID=491253 RepID=A0ABR0SSN0_9HYPO
MSPRLRLWGACRALAIRSQPIPVRTGFFRPTTTSTIRLYADDASSKPPNTINPEPLGSKEVDNGDEASKSVEQSSQEGSVEAGVSFEESHIDALDDATLEQILYGGRPVTSEREGGLTAAQEEALYRQGAIPPPEEAEALVAKAEAAEEPQSITPTGGELQNLGHKFGLPTKPYPEGFNLKKRYHPVLEQITRLLMRHGKLSAAQRNMAYVMNFLRTAPAPIYSPKFPLLPGTPPASHLPLNPVLYITIAIDSVAPLLKVRNIAGAGGGGRALEMPVPLAVRQRRRIAFQWILDVVVKKPSKGSGRSQFGHRIAEEIIAVVEGRSSVWEKRKLVHKLGTAARANVTKKLKLKKKK